MCACNLGATFSRIDGMKHASLIFLSHLYSLAFRILFDCVVCNLPFVAVFPFDTKCAYMKYTLATSAHKTTAILHLSASNNFKIIYIATIWMIMYPYNCTRIHMRRDIFDTYEVGRPKELRTDVAIEKSILRKRILTILLIDEE